MSFIQFFGQALVHGHVGALVGQGHDGNVAATQHTVGVHFFATARGENIHTVGGDHTVFQGEIIGKVRAALTGDANAHGLSGNVDVVKPVNLQKFMHFWMK